MSPRVKMAVTLVKLGIAAALSMLLLVIVVNAIKSPVDGETHSYTADFTDASGLHINGDIRIKGVRVGKVESIELIRQGGRSIAEVGFSLQKRYQLSENTVLAVKYQNLTGVRYIDLEPPAQPGKPVTHLTTAVTKPSFDITQLFNGLQPVLSTMSTDEINNFTQNAISLLQGDGSGLAPMMDSAQQLADLARDRQQVLSTLATNLSRIADTMGGRSPQVMDFLQSLSYSVGQAMTVLDQFQKTAVFGPEFTAPVHRLILELGLSHDMNIDQLLAQAFSSMPAAAEALRLLPGAFAGLQLPQLSAAAGAMQCSNGVATLPTAVKVLLNGSEVVVCNAH
ncbi:MCE family protein [Nocardia sp. ET3-3]|uniref:MCE family protein n=1 Tax=Nocardia terrae TaxID=2675851 RepID=A0A7K1V3Q8_9NOCA|nr:MlaD family protein [Nocardia terrae]MVU80778.1 MCE family protein [Nocardia terrae]